jgi:hypothetical protein
LLYFVLFYVFANAPLREVPVPRSSDLAAQLNCDDGVRILNMLTRPASRRHGARL